MPGHMMGANPHMMGPMGPMGGGPGFMQAYGGGGSHGGPLPSMQSFYNNGMDQQQQQQMMQQQQSMPQQQQPSVTSSGNDPFSLEDLNFDPSGAFGEGGESADFTVNIWMEKKIE